MASLRYVDGAGRTLPSYFADESQGSFLQSEPGSVSWHLGQVNHYNTRSAEDYLVKHSRGGGLNIAWELKASWAVFDRNEEIDRSIWSKLPAAKRLLAEWRQDGELVQLHDQSCRLYREHVSAFRKTASAGGDVV